MIFASGFFNTIILLGAVQGFVVSCLLFIAKKNRQSNRILAILIFLISLACFNLYANYNNWFNSEIMRIISNFIPMVIVMPAGPLLYFYIQSCLDPNFKITKKQRTHFYPVVIDIVPQITVIIFVVGILCRFLKNNPAPWGNFIDDYNTYADIPRWLSLSFYVWLSAKYLTSFKTKNNAALNGQTNSFKLLQQFVRMFTALQVIWFIFLIPYIIPKYSNALLDTFEWYPLYIPLVILIYWLGIKGYMISNAENVPSKKSVSLNSTLSDTTVRQSIALLRKAMNDDRLYLNPNLNLAIIAEHTGIAQKIISAVLNQHLEKSFSEFINDYRIEAFKEKILQPETENLTIAGIAFECGFNSQATFQRTFKQSTGLSPSEFRKTALQIQ